MNRTLDRSKIFAMPHVSGLWLKPNHGGAMKPIDTLTLKEGEGIDGNADQGGWRQVTVISQERWARVDDDLNAHVDPGLRRANVMVSGLNLADSRGSTLQLGECQVELRGETRPCRLMDEQHSGLRAALDADWGGGAFGVVVRSGTVNVGDEARLL